MEWFTNWWDCLTIVQQVFACFAVPATVLLIIQTILLCFGFGHHADSGAELSQEFVDDNTLDLENFDHDLSHDSELNDAHADDHTAGLRLISIRSIVAFFAVGGWVGIALIDCGINAAISSLLAFLSGLIALFIVAWFLKLLFDMQEDGSIDPKNAVAKMGKVYIRIPAKRSGFGKVVLTVQGTYSEMDAVTDCETDLLTDTLVQVVSITADNTLVVRPISK